MRDKITFAIPMTTCRVCGARGIDHVKVLHAVGHYCKECYLPVMYDARRHANRQLRDMLDARVIRLPTIDYDPALAMGEPD